MPIVVMGIFGGENTKVSPFLLQPHEAQIAENVDFTTGKITPLRAPALVRTAQEDTAALAVLQGRLVELSHAASTALVAAGAANERLIVTSAAFQPYVLRQSGNLIERLPLSVRINQSMAATAAVVGNANQGATPQTQTFALALQRSFDGAESELSAPVDARVSAGQTVNLSIPAGLVREGEQGEYPADTNFTAGLEVLVYRSISGAYQLVRRQAYDNTAATVALDYDAESGIGAQFVGQVTRARENLQGVGIHPKGFAYGFAGNRVCLSAAEQFGRWPRSYEVVIAEAIIEAIVEWDGALYVFPRGHAPRVVRLLSPEQPELPVPTESTYPCVSGGSVVNMGQMGVWYAAAEGVVRLPAGELLTRDVISEFGDAGRAFAPPSVAFRWRDSYLMPAAESVRYIMPRAAAGGLQIGTATVAGVTAAALLNGVLHVLAEGRIWRWGLGQTMTARWRSKRFKMVDYVDVPVAYVSGGGTQRHDVARNRYEGYFQPPLAAGAGILAAPVARFASSLSGDVVLTVRLDSNEEVVDLRTAAKPVDIFTDEQVDVQTVLAHKDVTSWAEIEINSGREVDYVGLFAAWEDIATLRDRSSALMSPSGFQG